MVAGTERGWPGVIQAYTVEQIRAVEAIALDRDGDETLMRRASFAVAARGRRAGAVTASGPPGGAAGRVRQQRR